MVVTRFAPSPNGSLHLGHAYSAVFAHDLARARGGRFLLRIEDLDRGRSRDELHQEFREDLAWLGLAWDEVPAQSSRLEAYHKAADKLREMGLLYPCVCTRAQIKAASVHTGPEGPVYPGTCRSKSPEEFPDVGAAWRLDLSKARALCGELTWEDAAAGPQRADPEQLGDPVLVRKDEPASYHLAATLDDARDEVTLVTRGADLFAATHVHRLLQTLLKLPVPRWHHHGLLLDETGKKLAKSRGSSSLRELREKGEDGELLARQLRLRRLPLGISLTDA
jgi:glutamyl-Q tRNA(Asp) synthetase